MTLLVVVEKAMVGLGQKETKECRVWIEATQKEWSAPAELMQSRSSGTGALPLASRLHLSAIGKSQPEYCERVRVSSALK